MLCLFCITILVLRGLVFLQSSSSFSDISSLTTRNNTYWISLVHLNTRIQHYGNTSFIFLRHRVKSGWGWKGFQEVLGPLHAGSPLRRALGGALVVSGSESHNLRAHLTSLWICPKTFNIVRNCFENLTSKNWWFQGNKLSLPILSTTWKLPGNSGNSKNEQIFYF